MKNSSNKKAIIIAAEVSLFFGACCLFLLMLLNENFHNSRQSFIEAETQSLKKTLIQEIHFRSSSVQYFANELSESFPKIDLDDLKDDSTHFQKQFPDLKTFRIIANEKEKLAIDVHSLNSPSDSSMILEEFNGLRNARKTPNRDLFMWADYEKSLFYVFAKIETKNLKDVYLGAEFDFNTFLPMTLSSQCCDIVFLNQLGNPVFAANGARKNRESSNEVSFLTGDIGWKMQVSPQTKPSVFVFRDPLILASLGAVLFVLLVGATVYYAVRNNENIKHSKDELIKFQTLIENAPVGVFLTDLNGKCTYVNPQWSKLTGLNFEKAQGEGWSKSLHPEDVGAVFAEWQSSVKENRPFLLNYRFKLPDGSINWVQGRSVEMKDHTGVTVGFLGSIVDLTESKLLETQVKQEHDLLTTIVEALPVGLVCKDISNNFNFTLWNSAVEKITGIPKEKALGSNDFEIFSENIAKTHRSQDLSIVTHDRPFKSSNIEHNGKAGLKILRTHKIAVKDTKGIPRYIIGVIENVTEEKKLEKVIQEKSDQILRSEKMASLGVMAAGVAHEINNPLAIIQGKAEFLNKLAEKETLDRKHIQNITAKILETVQRISRIVSALKIYSKESTQSPPTAVSLKKSYDEASLNAKLKIQANNISLNAAPLPENIYILGHPLELTQVIMNVICNAIDAANLSPEKWIKTELADAGDFIEFAVTDSGPGIPNSHLDKIFDPFFTTKEVGKGVGLGLTVCHQIMHTIGGEIRLDKSSPKTRFVLRFKKAAETLKNKVA